ncbi:hypothetical protein AK812_SmicGene46022, partial [Symbiodinium microadriaticum]
MEAQQRQVFRKLVSALEDANLAPDSEAFGELDKERCGILIGSAMGGTSLQTSMDNMDKLLK